MLITGTKVRPTQEAIQERAFGVYCKTVPFDPGDGTVISANAPMPGCVIVNFRSGQRMTHEYWLEAIS